MPWKETDVMNERTEFVLRAFRSSEPFGELCREYGISRKTGYKWKQRFRYLTLLVPAAAAKKWMWCGSGLVRMTNDQG